MATEAVARPRTSVFVGTSLDGFLARPDGSFDFLSAGGDADGASNGFDAFLASVDAVLMGRNTYEIDRLVVTRVPVLVGTGIALFGYLERDVRLQHVTTRVLPGGAVQSEYAVAR